MQTKELIHEINQLKTKLNVTILAHYYQPIEIQKIADYIGDSLGLAQKTQENNAVEYILFAGVHFMAETASILNQDKTILCPDLQAGCPLASFLSESVISDYKKAYPGAPLIVYVNTTAETKANAEVCCTSSNALKMVQKTAKIWKSNTILFGPDKNLANFIRENTSLEIITVPENGNCPVHNKISLLDVDRMKLKHPNASIIVHPESPIEVQKQAEFVGSTSQMLKYTQEHPNPNGFIIGTEIGLVDHLNWKYPTQKFFPLNPNSICKNMKKMSLEKIYDSLKSIGTPSQENYEVRVSPELAKRAKIPLERMMDYS